MPYIVVKRHLSHSLSRCLMVFVVPISTCSFIYLFIILILVVVIFYFFFDFSTFFCSLHFLGVAEAFFKFLLRCCATLQALQADFLVWTGFDVAIYKNVYPKTFKLSQTPGCNQYITFCSGHLSSLFCFHIANIFSQ